MKEQVIVNPNSNLYHAVDSYQGRVLRKPNQDGSTGVVMSRDKAIQLGYVESSATNSKKKKN